MPIILMVKADAYGFGLKESDGEMSFRVNISPSKTDAFIREMRNHIGEIIVEVFTPEKKDKNKK